MASSSRRPIMELLEILGQRWMLRILWELREGAVTFRALRTRCDDLSPSVLNARLAELRELELVELAADGYALTRDGQTLGALMIPLDAWARRWAKNRANRAST